MGRRFYYVAGSVDSARLAPHQPGAQNLAGAHRVRVTVALRGHAYEWIAPFEETGGELPGIRKPAGMTGRLTGFTAADVARGKARAVKDFRGWIWQSPQCHRAGDSHEDDESCLRSAFFSLRLPVGLLQDALFDGCRPVWPPQDLDQIKVAIEVLAPALPIPARGARA